MSQDQTGPERTPADTPPEDDAPVDIAAMLALSTQQVRRVEDIFARPTISLVLIWGVAWFVGFLVLWSASDQNPWFQTPEAPAGIVFGSLMVGGIISSIVIGSGMSRGIQGAQRVQGTLYGVSWAVGCTAPGFLGGALLANGMPAESAALFFPAAYALVVGLLYLAGGAIWRDRIMYSLGVWTILVGVIAPYFGTPGNTLVMAFAGGGGFLVYGAILLVLRRRALSVHGRSDDRRATKPGER
ncbi:hypothetical protein ACL9RL_05765 [Plantibacter sp. Mn2098]|uniref:hypothetical protein n=1 Tax=Plantibacter sp. Mn2098 TaxID=3395266 RepID=UPI003BE3D538